MRYTAYWVQVHKLSLGAAEKAAIIAQLRPHWTAHEILLWLKFHLIEEAENPLGL